MAVVLIRQHERGVLLEALVVTGALFMTKLMRGLGCHANKSLNGHKMLQVFRNVGRIFGLDSPAVELRNRYRYNLESLGQLKYIANFHQGQAGCPLIFALRRD